MLIKWSIPMGRPYNRLMHSPKQKNQDRTKTHNKINEWKMAYNSIQNSGQKRTLNLITTPAICTYRILIHETMTNETMTNEKADDFVI